MSQSQDAVRAALRLTLKTMVKPVFSARVPLLVQRRWLRELARVNRPPRRLDWNTEQPAGVRTLRVLPAGLAQRPDEAVLYLHGGAYIAGGPETHLGLTGHIAKAAEAEVWVPDYRLAPEHPFPAALDDAEAVFRELLEQGYEPHQITLMGDSAGGGLAVALCKRLRDQQGPLPARMVLMSPWADLSMPEYQGEHLRREVMLSRLRLITAARHYSGGKSVTHPLMSVLNGSLAGLPPVLIQVGSDEMLLEDSQRLAAKLEGAGNRVELQIFSGMWHVFQLHAGLLQEADQAIAETVEFMGAGSRLAMSAAGSSQ